MAVCFNAPVVETFREFDIHRHPGFGRLGPGPVHRPVGELELCARRIYDYPSPSAPIAEVLLDQHVACGVGNVYRSEILWACELSPFAHGALAAPGRLRAGHQRRGAHAAGQPLRHGQRVTQPDIPGGLAVYGRNGQRCARCGDTVQVKRHRRARPPRLLVPRVPGEARTGADLTPPGIDREMDPHPAAAKFLSELPWRRDIAG